MPLRPDRPKDDWKQMCKDRLWAGFPHLSLLAWHPETPDKPARIPPLPYLSTLSERHSIHPDERCASSKTRQT